MIKIEKMDITTVTHGVIAHGVNCQQAMGSGVAAAIKAKWPVVYTAYMKQPGGRGALGMMQMIPVSETGSLSTIYVANCYTQEFFGSDGAKYASLDAVKMSLEQTFQFAQMIEKPIFLPKIGAGLGGLDWDTEVFPVINALDVIYNEHGLTTICIWP